MAKKVKRTKQQQAFINAVVSQAREGGGRHFCLRARAGTGKTSTLLELVDDFRGEFPNQEITLCAYNKAAANEIKEKLEKRGHKDWKKINAATIHSLGFNLLKFVFKPKVDENKVMDIIKAQNGDVYQQYGTQIARLVSFAKLEGFGFFGDVQVGDARAWYKMADHYDVNGFDDTSAMDHVIEAAQHVYRRSLSMTDVVDFNDMILFPLVKNLRVKFPKDLLIVDEAQDTGRARQALLRKFIRPNSGIMIVVGDDRQGIYGFAGAQADALEQLITGLDMAVFPLTVSWRCPKAVIAEAQKLVSDIEWAPNAAQGKVSGIDELPELVMTDAFLCRNTAPLIERAYALLRKGIACKVEGREIGTGLVRMVNRWKVSTIAAFMTKLEDFKDREMQKAIAKGKESKAAEVEDRCATLVHLCNVCLERKQTSLDDLRKFIEDLFADDVKGVITLCTYHRSKGREWDRVFLIEHARRCPSPWAKQAWQKKQEDNLAYVAITRARQELFYFA